MRGGRRSSDTSVDPQDVLEGLVADSDFNVHDQGAANEAAKKQGNKNREILRAYAQVFATEQGKTVIEDLLNKTLREPVYYPERDNAELLGHVREGQNSLFRYIANKINQGRNLNQPTEDEG